MAFSPIASANTADITVDELLGFLQDSSSSDNNQRRSLANKALEQLKANGFEFSSGNLAWSNSLPRQDLALDIEFYGGNATFTFNDQATNITVHREPGNLGVDINLVGTLTANGAGSAPAIYYFWFIWQKALRH